MPLGILRAVVPLVGLALFATMALLYQVDRELYRSIIITVGVDPFSYPFVDWESMGASAQCWQHGVNVYVANPCDVLGRVYNYSPLWLRAKFIPTGRLWTNITGAGIDIAFICSLYFVLKPINWREVAVFLLASTSMVVVFALERTNIDVLLFIMVAAAGALGTGPVVSRLASYALLLFAGLLKFYPLIALVTALRERPRMFISVAAISVCVVGGLSYAYRDELAAIVRNLPPVSAEMSAFGAKNLPIGLAVALRQFVPWLRGSWLLGAAQIAFVAALLIAAGTQAFLLARDTGVARSVAAMAEGDKLILTLGAAVIAGCFFTGQSVEYRGIYLILVVAGLVALRRAADERSIRTRLAGVTVVVVFLMWEGLFRHAVSPNGSVPEGLSLPYHLFWLLRELLWWYLAGALLGVLAIFVAQSTSFVAGRQWLTRRGWPGQAWP